MATAQMLKTETKVCGACGREYPLSEFRRRHKDGQLRHATCRTCHNLERVAYRAERRRKTVGGFLKSVNRAAQRRPSRVEAVVRAAMGHFHGPASLVAEIHEWLTEARGVGKHHLVLRAYQAILHLMEVANEAKSECAPVLADMSDDEGWAYIRRLATEHLNAHPEVLIQAALDAGWQFVPPDDFFEDDQEPAE